MNGYFYPVKTGSHAEILKVKENGITLTFLGILNTIKTVLQLYLGDEYFYAFEPINVQRSCS
jgi:hypothetical protein